MTSHQPGPAAPAGQTLPPLPPAVAATPPATAGRPAGDGLRVVQRVVFPDADLDVVPLYAETNPDRGAADLAAEIALTAATGKKPTYGSTVPVETVGEEQSSIAFGSDIPASLADQYGRRRSAVISAGRRVSFGTYFNAFPASYWRRWTRADSVTLRLSLAGQATAVLYRSTSRGHCYPVETIRTASAGTELIERTLPLAPFIDGGWYWFDVVAGPEPVTLAAADWLVPDRPRAGTRGRVSIGITTFNQPQDMLGQLRTIAGATEIHDLLDAVYVVDQGSIRLTDQPGFAEAARAIGSRLQVIEQGNLGGSGGFARSMAETLSARASDYLLLMDDDVQFDPEGLLRAVAFADQTRRPTIVGGHMFSRYDRCVLHAFAEAVGPHKWWWGSAPNTRGRHDFSHRNLRNTPWLHRRADADYNGWWLCLIPVSVISELGLALPVFIKWDDAEYGVRARDHGYPTVSLPGVAAWQAPWDDKDDARDWQSYYHIRNRLVSALLHSPAPRGGALVWESMERQIQHLLSMQYSTAALRIAAVEDVLTGPGHLHAQIRTRLSQLREIRAQYADAQEADDVDSFPPARRRPPEAVKDSLTPTNKLNLLTKAGAGALRQLRPPRPGAAKRPQVVLPHQDASWFVLTTLDSAVVTRADGTRAAWYRRDQRLFRRFLRRSAAVHRRLRQQWPQLAADYRAAAGEFTSAAAWQQTFEASMGDRGDRVVLLGDDDGPAAGDGTS